LRLDPQNATAVLGMARVADLTGRESEQQQYLDQAAQIMPDHPWVQAQLQQSEDERNPEESIARREKIREQQPENLSNLVNLAELYVRTDQPEKAAEVYKQCYELQPTDLRVVDVYSRFLRSRGEDPQKAEQILRKAVEQIDGENNLPKAGAQLLLASHLNTMRERGWEKAASREQVNQSFEKAARISEEASVLLEVGTYFLVSNQFDKAEEYLNKTIAAAEDDPGKRQQYKTAYQRLLDLYTQTRDASRADEVLRKIDFYQQEFDEQFAMLARAEYLASIGRDNQALDQFGQYISRNPSDALGYYRRGLVYFRRSQWDQAINDFQEVKRLNPGLDDYEARILLAQAMQYNNQVEAAIDELQSLISENVTSFEIINRLFSIYVSEERWQSAINLIAPRRQQSESPLWPYLLSQISRQRGETNQAIELAIEAVRKSNYDWNMLSYLFNTYFEFERYENLVAYVQNQLPGEKQIPQITMRLANAYRALGRMDQAVEAYQQAYETEGAMPGELVAAFKEYASGQSSWLEPLKTAVRERIQNHPDSRGLKIVLAYIHQLSDEDQAFIELMEKLHAATEDGADKALREHIYFNRALASAHYKLGDYEKSRRYYRTVLELRPEDPPALNNLAYLLMDKLGDPESAIVYAKRAAELLPENASVLDTLGWNYILLNQYDEGIGWLYRAIELSPRSPSMHYHVAAALYRRSQQTNAQTSEKDLAEARKECTRAHQLIMETGSDPNNDLEKIADLGEKLGLNLETSLAGV
jgi:tetratricopeptide (TPR) repeat protein